MWDSIFQIPSWLTMMKAFVRSMNGIYRLLMSVVPLFAPHWLSGRFSSTSDDVSLFNRILARILLVMENGVMQ